MAARQAPEIDIWVHPEERSAAFIALGLARASGKPVAIMTTSGSAVMNCLPALVEAGHLHIPVILCSADRPPEYVAGGAPQSTQQCGFADQWLRAQFDAPVVNSFQLLEQAKTTLRTTLSKGLRPLPGPVQLNLPFAEPLGMPPDTIIYSDELSNAPDAYRAETSGRQQTTLISTHLHSIDRCEPGQRGVIVVGPDNPLNWHQVDALARGTGYPVLADCSSGLRRPAIANLIDTADALCAG